MAELLGSTDMTVFVGSLKYSPVYKSLCCAFGKECEKLGYSVRYLFAHEYKWLLSDEIAEKTLFVGNSTNIFSMTKDALSFRIRKLLGKTFSEEKPTHVYIHNYHFLNHHIAHLAKQYGSTFIYHVHEPYVENKKAHGGLQQYWLHLFEYLQEKLLTKTDVVIVSSKVASFLFDKRYSSFSGKKKEVPLMYEDLGGSASGTQERKYVTFVGPPVPAKGPEMFLEIVDYSVKIGLNLDFLLISRLKITDPRYYNKSNLTIFYKERIPDEEFGRLIQKSFAVITPYKRETQSAVIPASYMYGTPVVSSNVGGLPEFVFHKKTGYLVDKDAPVEEWIEGINYTLENFAQMSTNCRNHFVEFFSGENWEKYLNDLLA